MPKTSKRALTFTPPSLRAAKISEIRGKSNPSPTQNVPKAPRALAHPDNVQKQAPVVAPQEGVLVTIKDEEAVVVLGSLLDARDRALKAAELASGAGNEQLAEQQLGKAVALESLCERVGKAFVERRASLLKGT